MNGRTEADIEAVGAAGVPAGIAVYERVLVPVDFSDSALRGLRYGAMLARIADAELLVHVNVNLPEREVIEERAGRTDIDLDEAARRELADLARRADPTRRARTLATFDQSPGWGIVRAASDVAADLIVIASHGRTGLRRLQLGSVADYVVHHAGVPVVVVPSHTDWRGAAGRR